MFELIVGQKINLRPMRPEDAPSIRLHAKDRDVAKYTLIPHPYRLADAERFLEYSEEQVMLGRGMHFGIEDKATNQIIGVVGLEGIDHNNRRTEIGYWLGRKYWNQGFVTEAVCLVLRYAFTELNMKRVYAHVFPGNVASERLLLRCGFTYEGVLRSACYRRGRWFDCIVYAILREEFL